MNELSQALKQAAQLAEEAVAALQAGDDKKAAQLQQEADSAWWRARRLGQRQYVQRPAATRAPSARERMVSALADLGVPCSPKQIAAYSEAKTGERLDVRTLASIRRDEFRSWQSAAKRDSYLVPALEGPWLVAGRGRFALSHWPLWTRIVGPLSPRADHLKSSLHIADQIRRLPATTDVRVCMLDLLATYVRTVPGALGDAWHVGKDLNLVRIRAAVDAELSAIKDEDETYRKREADRATRTLDDMQLIWGGVMPQVVARKLG